MKVEVKNMLTKLIIKNFKSFKNETVIDLKKTKYEPLTERNTYDDVLKSLLFVGANASGKSNVIKAIVTLLEALFKETEINQGLKTCLFSNETEFLLDYYFLIDGAQVRYTIKNDTAKKFLSETLSVDNRVLLERLGSSAVSRIASGKEIKYVAAELDNETLLLRKLYFDSNRFVGNAILQKWYEFLRNSVYFNAFDKHVVFYGTEDLRIQDYIKNNGLKKLNDFFIKNNFDQSLEYLHEAKNSKVKIVVRGKEKTLFFRRKNMDFILPFNEESMGNQTLAQLLPAFLYTIEHDGMLLIDEFSSGFHNQLEKLIVAYFMEKTKKSQLIFISHSTNLLSTSLLRPDQIYSVSFKEKEGSKLNRFSEEKPRFAQNIEKMYLSGVFDGLPNYKDQS